MGLSVPTLRFPRNIKLSFVSSLSTPFRQKGCGLYIHNSDQNIKNEENIEKGGLERYFSDNC